MILREISCLFFRFVSWSQVLGLMIYQLYMAIFEILNILFYLKTQYFYLNTHVVIIIEYANKWTMSPEERRMNGQNYEIEKELDKQGSRVSIKHPAGEPILSCPWFKACLQISSPETGQIHSFGRINLASLLKL